MQTLSWIMPRRVGWGYLAGYTYTTTLLVLAGYAVIVWWNWEVTIGDTSSSPPCELGKDWTYLSCGFAWSRGLLIFFVEAILFFWGARLGFEFLLDIYLGSPVPTWLQWLRFLAVMAQMNFILLVGVVSMTEDDAVHQFVVRGAAVAFFVHEVLWLILSIQRRAASAPAREWRAAVFTFVHIGILVAAGIFAYCFSTDTPEAWCSATPANQAWYEYVLFLLFALVPIIHVHTLPGLGVQERSLEKLDV